MQKKEELKKLYLLYSIINDDRVQNIFENTICYDLNTGKIENLRVIDECKEYLVNKIENFRREN